MDKELGGQEKTVVFIAVFLVLCWGHRKKPINGGDVMIEASPVSVHGCIPSGLYETNSNIRVNKMAKSTLEVVDEWDFFFIFTTHIVSGSTKYTRYRTCEATKIINVGL
jgi:hypothetical protein